MLAWDGVESGLLLAAASATGVTKLHGTTASAKEILLPDLVRLAIAKQFRIEGLAAVLAG